MVKMAYNQTYNDVELVLFAQCIEYKYFTLFPPYPPAPPTPLQKKHFCECVRTCIATAKHLF